MSRPRPLHRRCRATSRRSLRAPSPATYHRPPSWRYRSTSTFNETSNKTDFTTYYNLIVVRHRVRRGIYTLVNISCRCTRVQWHNNNITTNTIIRFSLLMLTSWGLRTKHCNFSSHSLVKLGRNFKRQTRRRVSGFLSYTYCLLRLRSHSVLSFLRV